MDQATDTSVLYTGYNGSSSDSDAVYPYFLVPQRGTPVYPFRRCEELHLSPALSEFATSVRKSISAYGFSIFENTCLKFAEGGRCYFPEVTVISMQPGLNLRIDVEIDDPYDLSDFVPRHYLEDRTDSQRDHLMLQLGWTIVHFTEKQAVVEPENCAAVIVGLINSLVPGSAIPVKGHRPAPERKWTRITAEHNAKNGYRENYLGAFNREDLVSGHFYDKRHLSEEEHRYSEFLPKVPKIVAGSVDNKIGYNVANKHERDENIVFYPETHTYLYKGCDVLKSVTTVISEYFAAFDARAMADRKALKTGANAQNFIDKWGYTGNKASETGSFMHQQFENTFLGMKVESAFDFSYSSPTLNRKERIDISKELDMFSSFLNKNELHPYRTEWNIYDAEKGIAGSPDLIATYKGHLLMFDWKRSTKLIHPTGNRFLINNDCWDRYGFGALSLLPDNSFIHYSLQQCAYKYILEKHYGINLEGMFLVVIHPDYNRYYCIQVKDVSKYVEHIMERL